MAEKEKSDKIKKPNAIKRWWSETIGELRKVNWPTPVEAWRLTKIVLIVTVGMSVTLGLLDWIFAQLVTLLLV
mgnify:CR=1 FL=1